jgi:uncharacterized membrane protein
MSKNSTKSISIRQYRFTDSFLFAVILIAFDLLAHFAPILYPSGALYTFTLTIPIVLLVMMRWGWQSVFYAFFDGIFLTLLNNPTSWQTYLCYALGNVAIMLCLIPLKLIGKDKIRAKWYFSALLVFIAWLAQNIAISLLMAVCGQNILYSFTVNFGVSLTGLMSLAAALVIILVMRKLDGMFEDQKSYLLRKKRERDEQSRIDTYGDEPIDIDGESLSILNKRDNDLY